MPKNRYWLLIVTDGLMSLLAFGVVLQMVDSPGIRALAGIGIFGSFAATALILKQQVKD
jgi:hypothetical protein